MKNAFIASALAGAALFAGVGSASAATVYATEVDSGRVGVAGIGFEATSQVHTESRDDAGNALGAPDNGPGDVAGGFFSLGIGGAAVFGFGTSFGLDASVFEVTFGCGGAQNANGTCNYAETIDVYALAGAYTAFDGEFGLSDLTSLGFTKVGSIANGDANAPGGGSIAIGGPFSYLALIDTSMAGSGRDGFDIDSVAVSAVPLPASALFLLGGLGGLGFLRARRRA